VIRCPECGAGIIPAETASAFLEAAQDRLLARVEAALDPLPVGPERSERVRRALRDLDLAWPDPIRDEQYGCPCHSSYTIGGWELFVADDGTPRCMGGCPAEKILDALSIPVEDVRTAPGPGGGSREPTALVRRLASRRRKWGL